MLLSLDIPDTKRPPDLPYLIILLNSGFPKDSIDWLHRHPKEASYVTSDGTTALHMVLETGRVSSFNARMEGEDREQLVAMLLSAAPALAWSRNKDGRTPLEMAICEDSSGHNYSFSIVKYLIEAFDKSQKEELFLVGEDSLLAHALMTRAECTHTIDLLMDKPYCRGSEEMRARYPQRYLHKVLHKSYFEDDEQLYELICKIICSHPESVKLWGPATFRSAGDDATQTLPIHLAMNVTNPSLPQIVEALIEAEPWTALAKDGNGLTPLEGFSCYNCSWNELRPVMMPLLRVIYLGTECKDDSRQWRDVHAVLSAPCPPSIAREVMELNPGQMFEINESGNLPLHLAATFIAFDQKKFDNGVDICFDDCYESGELPEVVSFFERLVEEARNDDLVDSQPPSILSCALEANLAGAGVLNNRGDLPLHIAVKHHVTWDEGVEELIRAEPRALTSRNTESHMYPFMLAAVAQTGDRSTNSAIKSSSIRKHATWEKSCVRYGKSVSASKVDKYASKLIVAFVDLPNLTTIYRLIRANPEPISCGVPLA